MPSSEIAGSYGSYLGFPGGSGGEESTCNVGNLGSVPGLGRSPGGGHGNPLQCSWLENPMARGAWRLQSMGSHSVRCAWAPKHTPTWQFFTVWATRGVVLFLASWQTSILFSTSAAAIYVPISSVQGFPFLRIFANICYLCSFLMIAILTDVRWYFIVVLVCISVMISHAEIFLCVCWPFVCLL